MLLFIPFPAIDPIIFQIGPIAIKWYGLSYAIGLILGIYYLKKMASLGSKVISGADADDFLTWACLGVILGGRIGYVLFYNFFYYLDNPIYIFYVWQGGMSFHGGFLGVIAAGIIFSYKRKIPLLRFSDMVVCVVPIGLFFGRISNFINQELVGRVTDVWWGMVFPKIGPEPRHPSQLYEAILEGMILFLITNFVWRSNSMREKQGLTSGIFVGGYGLFRMVIEFFRQPDEHIGYLSFGSTLGQWLSLPMICLGGCLIIFSRRNR